MAAGNDVYLGNPNLKKAGTPIQFTKKQIDEWIKCKNDPIYFATNYIQIISLDEGLVPFKICLLYTSPSPRDATLSRMPSSA